MPASVRTATILISDLVGSTGLASRVGPTRADELRREHFSVLRTAVADTGGEEVKNTGDGLMAAFSSVAAAVRCAVAMQQGIERRNRAADEQLHIRVGVATGEATVEEGDYFGMPSIEAARLCDSAPGDGILTTELVRMLAARSDAGHFEPAGMLELKGIPEPVEASRVVWDPVTESARLPLPPRLAEVPEVSFVGRAAEREQLAAAWREASGGARRVVLLSGEPGIGKTRLASYQALHAHEDGATVLYGRCDEELGVAYQPWLEALRHYVATAPEAALREHVELHGGELARLAPELCRRVDGVPEPQASDPETERYLLFSAVAGLLSAAAPLVVVLDDLHWADRPTLLLLRHLVDAGVDVPMLVLGTFRDSELSHENPLTDLLADLRRQNGAVTRVGLKGLEAGDVVALLEGVTGQPMRDPGIALAGQLAHETDGNPFFVAELLRHMRESGAVVQDEEGRWALRDESGELGLPESVREVIGRRAQRLGEETRRTLAAAAVIGRDFEFELLAEIVEQDEDAVLDRLDAALEASLIGERAGHPGWFTFTHALVEHTLYEDLGSARRARLHRRIALALERQLGDDPGERVGELARHWSEAVKPVETAKAADYATQAGRRALDQLAPDEAQRWFERALELLEGQDGELRREVLVLLGDARRQTGDSRYRDTLLGAAATAAASGDADRQARAVLATWRGMPSLGHRDDDLVAALEAAAAALPQDDPRRAEVLAEIAAELTFSAPLERRRSLADEALALARRADDPRLLNDVLLLHTFAVWVAHTIDERVEHLEEASELAEHVGDPGLTFLTASRACNVLEAGDLAGFDRCVEQMSKVLDAVPQPIMRWTLHFTQAPRAQLAGRLDEAEALAIEALTDAGGSADAMTIFGGQILAIRLEQGRLAELVDLIAQAVVDNPALPTFRAAHALALCEADRRDEAAALISAAAADGFASTPLDSVWSTTLANWSEVAWRLDDRHAAAPLYDLLLPHARTIVWNGASTLGPVTRHLGRLALVLGRYDDAEAHLHAATAEHERLGAPIWQAQTDYLLGLTLLRRPTSDRERAQALLSRAAEAAERHGAAAIARDANAALRDPALT